MAVRYGNQAYQIQPGYRRLTMKVQVTEKRRFNWLVLVMLLVIIAIGAWYILS